MAVSAYAIPSLTHVKNYLKMDTSVTTSDTILETWIDAASYEIEQYCKRKFTIQSVSGEIYDGDGTDKLYVRYWPVTQLSTETTPTDAQKLASVQYRSTPDSSWTDIETDVDHIFLNVNWPYLQLYDSLFPAGIQNIKISYKAGYSVIPGDIWRVSVEMSAMMWNNSKQSGDNRLGVASKSMGGFTDSFKDLKPEWKIVMDRYKIPGGQHLSAQTPVNR